ncbi:MAG: hypothetical protein WD055_01985 [Candidatus Dependentiae bacterium]
MVMRDRVLKFFAEVVTLKYQIVALIITSFMIVLFAVTPFLRFVSFEPSPAVFSVTPKKVKEWGGNTTEVAVGLHITNFPEFDLTNNRFMFDGIIWFEFDPALVSLETVEKFSFEKGEIIKKTTSDTKVIEGKFFAQYNITVKFTTNLSFEYFPLDDHRVFISLINKFVTPSEIVYSSYISGFTLSEDIFVAGWRVVGHNVVTGYSQANLDTSDKRKVVFNPKVIFSMDFERSGVSQVFFIFLPLFLMFFIGIFSFSFDAVQERRLVLPLSLGSVTAILSYRFVIQRMSPVAGYFLLSDHIFSLFLTFAFIGFLLNIVMITYGKIEPWVIVLRAMVLIFFHVLLIGWWYYLLYVWARV